MLSIGINMFGFGLLVGFFCSDPTLSRRVLYFGGIVAAAFFGGAGIWLVANDWTGHVAGAGLLIGIFVGFELRALLIWRRFGKFKRTKHT